jgi:putative ABC transport system permease protein
MNNSNYLALSWGQVALALLTTLCAAILLSWLRTQLHRPLLWATLRMLVQLGAIGFVLQWIFRLETIGLTVAWILIMTTVAGFAAVKRIRYPFRQQAIVALAAIAGSSWPLLTAALLILRPEPLASAAYAIPLLGMILGNSLNAISLAIDRYRSGLIQERERVENLLVLGASGWEAGREIAIDAVRVGLLPMINTMSVTGIVSLPGMMTGQLLSGVSPLEAVKYQLVIMALIATTTATGCTLAVWLTYRQSFSRWQALIPLPAPVRSNSADSQARQ